MASKLSPQQADEIFYQSDMEIREKLNFLLVGLQLKNKGDIRMGPTDEMIV